MNDLSIFPADIAEMSVAQLAKLPVHQLYEVDTNLDQAIAWLKSARTKVDLAWTSASVPKGVKPCVTLPATLAQPTSMSMACM